jgi:hypothetical protein
MQYHVSRGYHLAGIRFFSFNIMKVSGLGISCRCKDFTPYERTEPAISTNKNVSAKNGKKLSSLLGHAKRLFTSILCTDNETPNCDSTGYFWYI